MASDLTALFQPGDAAPSAKLWTGTVESWDASTGANSIRVGGGLLLNVPALKAGAAALKVGDVVNLLSAGNRWWLLGNATSPGDPGTVPSWDLDITALTGTVDTIQNVTIPAVQNDVAIVQGDVVDLGTDVATAQSTADAAQSVATAAAADASTALGKFPITETDITDDAITTPKIAANAVTAAEIAANAVTTSALAANAVTAAKIAAGTITATEISSGAITAAKLDAAAITGKTITGGLFRTATSGKRVEIDTANQIRFYSGITGETAPGTVEAQVEASQYASTRISSPTVSSSPQALFILGSRSDTGHSSTFLYSDSIRLNGLNTQVVMDANTVQLNASSDLAITANRLLFNGYNAQVGGPYWFGYLSSAPSPPAASTLTTLTGWTALESDSITLSSGVFTVPEDGLYRVSGQIWWAPAASAAGLRLIQAVKTNSPATVIASVTVDPPVGTTTTKAPALCQWNKLFRLTAGDTVIVRFQHTSGGTEANRVPTATTQDISFFQIARERL